MANPWFKFYAGDYLSDPKVRNFSALEHSCWIHLLCFAGNMSVTTGVVTHVTERLLSVYAGAKEGEVAGFYKKLESLGMIKMQGESIVICNWENRQNSLLTNAEKQKAYRDRLKEKSNKTVTTRVVTPLQQSNPRIDKNKNRNKPAAQSTAQPVVDIIDAFKDVNPSYGKWFGNKTQRAAAERMFGLHGLEQVLKVIKILPQTNTMAYLPTVTTPVQLEDKWAALAAGLIKHKGALQEKGRGLA